MLPISQPIRSFRDTSASAACSRRLSASCMFAMPACRCGCGCASPAEHGSLLRRSRTHAMHANKRTQRSKRATRKPWSTQAGALLSRAATCGTGCEGVRAGCTINMRGRGWAHQSDRLAIESGVGLPHCRKSCRRRWCTEELVQPARCAEARAAGACAAARQPAAPGRHDRPKSCCNMRCVATCAVLQHGTTWYRPAQTPRQQP